MIVGDVALKSVAYVGVMSAGKFHPRATCFFVGISEGGHLFQYLVTAEHVIERALSAGNEIFVRANFVGGGCGQIKLELGQFVFHPNSASDATDVAICPFGFVWVDEEGKEVKIDACALDLDKGQKSFAPDDNFLKESMRFGAEVCIVGLFSGHAGRDANEPVVRVGNIAALPKEKVVTANGKEIEALLIEARSIGGLSGSPVVLYPSMFNFIARKLRDPNYSTKAAALIGLVHGHFDLPLAEGFQESGSSAGVNSGIGVVVPVQKILDTLDHPDLIAIRKAEIDRRKTLD